MSKAWLVLRGLPARLEKGFVWLWDTLLFSLMLVVLVRPRWKHLRQGRRDYDCGARRTLDPDHAQYLFDRSLADSEHTDGKVRQLLTLSSVLTPIALVLSREAQPRGLALTLVGALVATVLLSIANLSTRVQVFPTLEPADQETEEAKAWAWDVFTSTQANRALHQLRVDIYIAAYRYFVLAFILAPVLALLSIGPRGGAAAAPSAWFLR